MQEPNNPIEGLFDLPELPDTNFKSKEEAVDALEKVQGYLEKISDIETRLMNMEDNFLGDDTTEEEKGKDKDEEEKEKVLKLKAELNEKLKLLESNPEKAELPEEDVNTKIIPLVVGTYVSIYGQKYQIKYEYPRSYKLKKIDRGKHLMPIKKGTSIRILGSSYTVLRSDAQQLTILK